MSTTSRGGDLRRCSTQPHQAYGGLDLPARTLSVGLLDQDGAILGHRQMRASPEAVRKVMAPARDELVVAIAWLFPGSGRAARCAHEGLPFALRGEWTRALAPGQVAGVVPG